MSSEEQGTSLNCEIIKNQKTMTTRIKTASLLLMTTTFILFRLPISLLLIELFSVTNGSIEVPAHILMNNVILSKVILNLIVFIYLLIKLYTYLCTKYSAKAGPSAMMSVPQGLTFLGTCLTICYLVFDGTQVYEILK